MKGTAGVKGCTLLCFLQAEARLHMHLLTSEPPAAKAECELEMCEEIRVELVILCQAVKKNMRSAPPTK